MFSITSSLSESSGCPQLDRLEGGNVKRDPLRFLFPPSPLFPPFPPRVQPYNPGFPTTLLAYNVHSIFFLTSLLSRPLALFLLLLPTLEFKQRVQQTSSCRSLLSPATGNSISMFLLQRRTGWSFFSP